jgi:Metal binding domain of Ada
VSIIVSVSLDFAECDWARLARDPSCDGRFYTGVRTTGIYCRHDHDAEIKPNWLLLRKGLSWPPAEALSSR